MFLRLMAIGVAMTLLGCDTPLRAIDANSTGGRGTVSGSAGDSARTGSDCLIGLDEACGQTSPRIQVTTPCPDRTLVSCNVYPDETAQTDLDHSVGVPDACLGQSAPRVQTALSVWFNGDCPSSFIVYPPDLADCVKAYLETVRFDCAAGLVCGASGMTGGCAC